MASFVSLNDGTYWMDAMPCRMYLVMSLMPTMTSDASEGHMSHGLHTSVKACLLLQSVPGHGCVGFVRGGVSKGEAYP